MHVDERRKGTTAPGLEQTREQRLASVAQVFDIFHIDFMSLECHAILLTRRAGNPHLTSPWSGGSGEGWERLRRFLESTFKRNPCPLLDDTEVAGCSPCCYFGTEAAVAG